MTILRLALFAVVVFEVGCASWGRQLKDFLGGGDSTAPQKKDQSSSDATKYSDNPDMAPRVRRQYKRTTKESLADESGLDQKAGSLWVMEGQGAYLFAQNPMRLVGDSIGVAIEGEPKEQLLAKTDIIKDLLSKIEERQKARQRALAAENSEGENKEPADKEKAEGKEKEKEKKTAENKTENKPTDFGVKIVPTRIVERTIEGNYRVKGSQPFMIGSREFKVIVTGVVRAEDFSDEGIAASKLLDPKFDIVSIKRAGAEL